MMGNRYETDGFSVTREGSHFFVYRFPAGSVKAAHLESLIAFEREAWAEGMQTLYIVVILGDKLVISPGAIVTTAQRLKGSPLRITAFVAQSFVHRIAMQFMVRASRGIGVPSQEKIFADEASAMDWITRKKGGRGSLSSIHPNETERRSSP